MEKLIMSRKEVERIPVFEELKSKKIKQKEAALKLSLSVRQVRRKMFSYQQDGAKGLIHQSRGKPGNHRLDPSLKERALVLVRAKYPDFGPTFASEKLQENHSLTIGRETLRKVMTEAGLWRPKRQKIKHRKWRERKTCFGELIQMDGSDHDWFEGRAPRSTLLAFIDDATGRVVHAEFAQSESNASCFAATRRYVEAFGRPLAIYVDRGKVFSVNLGNENKDRVTQYGRALAELSIKLILALSPQAKGRVERLFGTLQDRLVKELRLNSISDTQTANRYLIDAFIPEFNRRFSIEPKSTANMHRALSGFNLDTIFCLKETRKLLSDFTVRYKSRWFQLSAKQSAVIRPGDTITVIDAMSHAISLFIRTARLNFIEISKPIKPTPMKIKTERKPWVPPVDHPWRQHKKADISKLQKEDISILV